MKFILGLGNPGSKYKKNRHNVGFLALDYLVEKRREFIDRVINKNELQIVEFKKKNYIFVKPLTYMNLSGKIISFLRKKYFLKDSRDLFVIYDDLDLNFGRLKIKFGGSSGGHKGVESIISFLGKDFTRIRIGIGRPKDRDVVRYVLSDFSKNEIDFLYTEVFPVVDDIVEDINSGDSIEKIMTKYNRRN